MSKKSVRYVEEIMTKNPVLVSAEVYVEDAALEMKRHDIGDVLVMRDNRFCGIVTDRDIAIRAVAERLDPSTTRLGAICSADLVTVRPSDDVDRAAQVMREHSLRRLPVVDAGLPVGIVTLGDLALENDPGSALAGISSAPPNK